MYHPTLNTHRCVTQLGHMTISLKLNNYAAHRANSFSRPISRAASVNNVLLLDDVNRKPQRERLIVQLYCRELRVSLDISNACFNKKMDVSVMECLHFLNFVCSSPTYFIAAPNIIRVGVNETIMTHILGDIDRGTTVPVTLELKDHPAGTTVYDTKTIDVSKSMHRH